jgi:hypothetical protein
MRLVWLAPVSMLVGIAGAASAAMPNAKPGLWESTSTAVMEAGIPPNLPNAARMSDQDKAKMQQSLSPMGGRPMTTVARECTSPEMMAKWDAFTRGQADTSNCRRTVMELTAQHVRIGLVCDGGKATGEMDFTAAGTDRVVGKMTLLMRSDRGDSKLNMEMNSRWVSSDCGGLKPGERQQLRGG